jgi:hypothetical protein
MRNLLARRLGGYFRQSLALISRRTPRPPSAAPRAQQPADPASALGSASRALQSVDPTSALDRAPRPPVDGPRVFAQRPQRRCLLQQLRRPSARLFESPGGSEATPSGCAGAPPLETSQPVDSASTPGSASRPSAGGLRVRARRPRCHHLLQQMQRSQRRHCSRPAAPVRLLLTTL